MNKRDMLSEGLANVRESMGEFASSVRGAPIAGPRAIPPHLQGVTRSRDVSEIEVDRIVRDPSQPREEFEPEALGRLAASLKARGQLQPIRVRWSTEQGAYMVIVGERRLRAAKMAGLATLACVVVDRPVGPDELLEIQLVENAVREDLAPMEQAAAYRRLIDARGWSVRQLAAELSIHHAAVVRALALLELPAEVQGRVEQGGLSPATAYEVSKLDDPADQLAMAEAVAEHKMSRAEVAEAVRSVKARRPAAVAKPEPVSFDTGDGTVKISWRKAGLSAIQMLRRALKEAQDRERQGEASESDAA